jgi:uncharacterized protein
MKIAIIGAGVSGLVSAWILARRHEVVVYEKAERIGGHTHTHDVDQDGRSYRVDSGFIVFNERNYPNLCRIFDALGVASKPTDMSFGVKVEASGLEYNATNLDRLFAQRRNLFRPSFLKMVRDITRFFREAPAVLEDPKESRSLGEYLDDNRYSEAFLRDHMLPIAASLWSTSAHKVRDFPIVSIVEFFANHRMLQVDDRPQWRVVVGGSDSYLAPLTESFASRIRTSAGVSSISREDDGVQIKTENGDSERFDEVVIAAHSDQALRMLSDADDLEKAVLGDMPYQDNDVILHTDEAVMPRRKKAWAAWNYFVPEAAERSASVTYDMNILQGLQSSRDFLVSLNRRPDIDPARVHAEMTYHHPLFNAASVAAKKRFAEMSGRRRTHFCGAYWGHGFHEDGVKSALRVCEAFGMGLDR